MKNNMVILKKSKFYILIFTLFVTFQMVSADNHAPIIQPGAPGEPSNGGSPFSTCWLVTSSKL